MFQIAVFRGRQLQSTHPLQDGEILVGRGEDCAIVVAHESVSRQHFILRLAGGVLELEDKLTPNGTYVNGQRVPSTRLLEGDRIELGTWALVVERAPVGDDLPPLPPEGSGSPSEESTMRATAEQMEQLRHRGRQQRAAHLVQPGDQGPVQHPLADGGTTIGFSEACHVPLAGSGLFGKVAAEIKREGTRWVLTARSALVPVKVDGERVKRHVLGDGETLEIKGQRLRFRGPVE